MGTQGKTIRVVVVDDQVLYRECLVNLIDLWPEFTVVGQAADGRQAIRMCCELHPDVILLDVQMPGMSGIEAAEIISKSAPDIAIIMLTVETASQTVLDSLQMGVGGYLLKDTPADKLRSKIHSVLQGTIAISDAVNVSIVEEVNRLRHATTNRSRDDQRAVNSLTKREIEVLYLVAEGKSNEEIASELYLSVSTVKKQVASIMQKFGATNRVQIASKAFKLGLVE